MKAIHENREDSTELLPAIVAHCLLLKCSWEQKKETKKKQKQTNRQKQKQNREEKTENNFFSVLI